MSQSEKGKIRIGIGGWAYAPWRGTFYPKDLPQKRELAFASQRLTSIEINATFYRTQKPESFAAWRDSTPDEFVFSLKAPRFTTHRRTLADAGESIERFVASGVAELGTKLGVINWQFAPTKTFDPQDFTAFLKLLPRSVHGQALRHALEVRHMSFHTRTFLELAREAGVAVVIAADSPYPQLADMTAPFVYIRIMGARQSERLGYAEAEIALWARRAKIWASGGEPDGLSRLEDAKSNRPMRDVYLYVIGGEKVRNPAAAMALISRLNN
ncbi:DUF72 domain-containing protein [Rhodoblastus acidophilus]|uniref:DUF72 domain-containing protein n=1 Tax=Rhodoblastus acidophilus TaxID=1074 RepID=UPI0022254CDD|nr:DUF72 domain-containing protein [Rhodoblastus acidophilus]